MSLSSGQLDAFAAVARTLHFSRAAKQLGITQSALSQRVANLEDELALSLFARGPTGVRLTEAGARLLRYCQTKDQLESEILADLVAGSTGELAGVVRIAGYSSVIRSVIMPALAPLLREHPRVQAHYLVRETKDLPALLGSGEAEFVIADREITRSGIETVSLGEETHVLVESDSHRGRDSIYLDHDPDDLATQEFLKRLPKGEAGSRSAKEPIQRTFVADIYGILDGVAQGLGRGVVSKHLLKDYEGIRLVRGAPTQKIPVVAHYHVQPVYPRLHQAVLRELEARCEQRLGP